MSDLINKIKVYKQNYRDAEKSHIKNINEYKKKYNRSIKDPEGFWIEQAERLDWVKNGTKYPIAILQKHRLNGLKAEN